MSRLAVIRSGAVIALRSIDFLANPRAAVLNLVVLPLLDVGFMAAVSSSVGVADSGAVVLAATLQAGALCATTSVGSLNATDTNAGILSFTIVGGTSHLALAFGRAVVVLVLSAGVAGMDILLTLPFVHTGLTWHQSPAVLLVVLVNAGTSAAMAIGLNAIAIRMRDPYTITNLAGYGVTLLCGVVAPVGTLPGWLRGLAQVLPLTDSVEAIRHLSATGSTQPPDVLLAALGVGVAWLAVGEFLWHRSLRAAQITGTLEL